MTDNNIQLNAEAKVLYYKLDRIRNHIESRIDSGIDAITSAELVYILDMISAYETVPAEWELEKPLVPINNIPKEVK